MHLICIVRLALGVAMPATAVYLTPKEGDPVATTLIKGESMNGTKSNSGKSGQIDG